MDSLQTQVGKVVIRVASNVAGDDEERIVLKDYVRVVLDAIAQTPSAGLPEKRQLNAE